MVSSQRREKSYKGRGRKDVNGMDTGEKERKSKKKDKRKSKKRKMRERLK